MRDYHNHSFLLIILPKTMGPRLQARNRKKKSTLPRFWLVLVALRALRIISQNH